MLTIFFFTNCEKECIPHEYNRFLMTNESKEYLNTNKRDIKFLNENQEEIIFTYEEGNISIKKNDAGDDEGCGYYTIESGEQLFNFGNYRGKIEIGQSSLSISISNYVSYNFNVIDTNGKEFNDITENIEIQGFEFNNVLVLLNLNTDENAIWDIDKIVYSKQYGIEFISFRGGKWLKQIK